MVARPPHTKGAFMLEQLRVVVVSKNEIERQGLCRVLTEATFEVLGGYRDHLDLDLDLMAQPFEDAQIVLIDSNSDEETFEACHYVRENAPGWKIVVFASNCRGRSVFDAFSAGVDGYVGKHISVRSLAEMLKLVALGEKMIPSEVFFDLAAMKVERPEETTVLELDDVNLSDREIEILRGLIRGDANKVISRDMMITEATVKVHVKSILRKLGVMNRTQAAIWGITRGLGNAAEIEEPFSTKPMAMTSQLICMDERRKANGNGLY
jgi:two-component system nitrate/nitrite response regulator NarL